MRVTREGDFELLLIRHGVAEEWAPGGDAERPLTAAGELQCRRAARGLAYLGLTIDAAMTRPFLRARETADSDIDAFCLGCSNTARRRLLLLLLITALGCSSSPTRKAEEAVVAAGAEQWTKEALLLPAEAPLVAEIHLLEFFKGLNDLRTWWAKEPEMFGPEGQRTGELANLYWGILSTYTGGDPCAEHTWKEMGIDARRPIRTGLYGVGEGVASILETIRRQSFEQVHAGFYEDVLESTTSATSPQGSRWLVPVFDPVILTTFVKDLAETIGYRALTVEERVASPLGTDVTAYIIDDLEFPLVAVRIIENTMVIDLVFDGPRGPSRVLAIQKTLADAVAMPAGRPRAARPPGDFLLGLGMNQRAMADIVTVRGIRNALDGVGRLDAQRRDSAFHDKMKEVKAQSGAWFERSQELPGLAYSVSGPSGSGAQKSLLSLEMTFYLGKSQPPLKTSPIQRGIQVEAQGMGVRADFGPLHDPAWRAVLSHVDPDSAMESMDAGEEDILFFALSFPRTLALLIGNLADAGPEGFSPGWAPLIASMPSVARLDAAVSEISESAPLGKVIFLGTMRSGLPADEMQDAARSLAAFVDHRVAQLKGSSPSLQIGAFEPEVAMALTIAGAPGAILYSASRAEVLIGVYMEVEELKGWEARLGNGATSSKDIFYLRLEPASFFTWMRWLDADVFGRLDVGRLAQRMGPLEVRVSPDSHTGGQMLRWRATWMAVPSLE